jgi:hypothetical protein
MFTVSKLNIMNGDALKDFVDKLPLISLNKCAPDKEQIMLISGLNTSIKV